MTDLHTAEQARTLMESGERMCRASWPASAGYMTIITVRGEQMIALPIEFYVAQIEGDDWTLWPRIVGSVSPLDEAPQAEPAGVVATVQSPPSTDESAGGLVTSTQPDEIDRAKLAADLEQQRLDAEAAARQQESDTQRVAAEMTAREAAAAEADATMAAGEASIAE